MGSAESYVAVFHAASDSGWPYDLGDDPSFRATETTGVLTWGICRRNLRRKIAPSDLVIFCCEQRLAQESRTAYRLVAWARVERLVSQTEIWTDESLAKFRTHRNLLIRPVDGTEDFEYHEELPKHLAHFKQWLWMLSPAPRGERASHEAAAASGVRTLPGGYVMVGSNKLRPARNYVLFNPSATRILADPPIVAYAAGKATSEHWIDTPVANALHSIIFTRTDRPSLRVPIDQFALNHIVLSGEADDVEGELENAGGELGFVYR